MHLAGSFADFHIEFTGTNSWLHMTEGHQFVFLIPPTQNNILRVEHWHTLTDEEQDENFIEYWSPNCTCVRMNPGQTLLIPSGWISKLLLSLFHS
jgi:F-box/leucine-rich repeat protein 10/11